MSNSFFCFDVSKISFRYFNFFFVYYIPIFVILLRKNFIVVAAFSLLLINVVYENNCLKIELLNLEKIITSNNNYSIIYSAAKTEK